MAHECMRDIATSKRMRDSVTGKLQRKTVIVYDDCEFCAEGTTPEYITLTIDDLAECSCPGTGFTGYTTCQPYDISTILNGTSHILHRSRLANGDPYGDEPCLWYKEYGHYPVSGGGFFGTIDAFSWANPNCPVGPDATYPFNILRFYVRKTAADELLVEIYVSALGLIEYGPPPTIYHYTGAVFIYGTLVSNNWLGKVTSLTDCLVATDLANCLVCVTNPYALCSSGTISIVEGASSYNQTDYRVPTSDAAIQWSSTGGNNYSELDDPFSSPDDDSTYVSSGTGGLVDYYGFTPFEVPTGKTITSLQFVYRVRLVAAGGAPNFRTLLRINGTTYYGSNISLYLDWYTFTMTWTVNPATGSAWTPEDINGTGANPLQYFGFQSLTGGQMRVTQAYLKVNYVM